MYIWLWCSTKGIQSSHHPQEVLLAQFSLYVHKGGLKPDSFHFLPKAFTHHTGYSQSGNRLYPVIWQSQALAQRISS